VSGKQWVFRFIQPYFKAGGRLLALFFAAAFVLVLAILPNLPDTLWGWLGLLALALPVVMIAEWLGHILWKSPGEMSHIPKEGEHRVSLRRLAYGLGVMLLACGFAWGMAVLLGMK
jgi:hypothetical protein